MNNISIIISQIFILFMMQKTFIGWRYSYGALRLATLNFIRIFQWTFSRQVTVTVRSLVIAGPGRSDNYE